MRRTTAGWWEAQVAEAGHGTDYAFRLDGGDARPDPRSRWQPQGVHAASRVYDHSRYQWGDSHWHGLPLEGSVLYELHVGTFTEDGTFAGVTQRLDHLVDLGITAVELLPVNSFEGSRGWGYDGVGLYAAHEPYGGPDGLKQLVDACHQRGLGVVLDVVYNHLGPSGNYLSEFGPYFTDTHHTPWGAAVNLDAEGSDEVRRWIIDNALMWLGDFHIDGLRLDAVHALVDTRAVHLLEQLGEEVHVMGRTMGKPLFVVAESDLNDPRLITPIDRGGMGLDGQWCDDVHHALHATLTGERQGYYADFGSLETLATALTSAFVHADSWSSFRGRSHGRPVNRATTPGFRFVTYLQDHDQVGNRAIGDRLSATVSLGRLMIGATLLFCSPYTPMLFMGEEWGATTPWQFFTSFDSPELAKAVREGRRAEFASHGWKAEDVPDPQAPETFECSRLDWSEADEEWHARLLDWYRRLIALRRDEPGLSDPRLDQVHCEYDERAQWLLLRRGSFSVVCNFAAAAQLAPDVAGRIVMASDDVEMQDGGVLLQPESVVVLRHNH